MARSPGKRGYTLHLIESFAGQARLAAQGFTTRDLARAIVNYQRIEGVRVSTLIGVNDDGFFGSTREGWTPDAPDAFAEPLISIPWGQLHLLRDAIEDPVTGELRYPGMPTKPN